MTEATRLNEELVDLVHLFFDSTEQLGQFDWKTPEECPQVYRDMLAHTAHMTVTVERRHDCEVTVEVLESKLTEEHYLRKILLRRTSDHRVVQFGIVRLKLAALRPEVRDEIMAQQTPLGRVLIKHDVLRHVKLNAVWEVRCAPALVKYFELDERSQSSAVGVNRSANQSSNDGSVVSTPVTFGRTALIYCDGEPAVELLEIVAPEESF